MEDSDRGATRAYNCDSTIDFPTALEAGSIEHLGVDSRQMVIIYQRAIFILTATEGDLDTAEAIEIELWEPPLDRSEYEPAAVIESLVDKLMILTGASFGESDSSHP
ncbi:hypothetical protein [Halorubrum vacuolatum]|uniref:Uncharacterized protein n=1 Tax=Halorubrum vacuolatum TaxID=63740 RepID=A0A238YKJ5_HALVU|nr:hypothetical protein [Halorubrum vacuolatum]SNR71570.1 hypothetical protein SAMN06264855_1552 [Halorubrum vacuolatum]